MSFALVLQIAQAVVVVVVIVVVVTIVVVLLGDGARAVHVQSVCLAVSVVPTCPVDCVGVGVG